MNELERAARLGRGVVSSIETGRRPHPDADTIRSIADVTRFEFQWLFFGEGPERRGDTLPPPPRRPNLERAIEMLAGELSPRAAEIGRRMGEACPVDIDVAEWILVLRNVEKKISQP